MKNVLIVETGCSFRDKLEKIVTACGAKAFVVDNLSDANQIMTVHYIDLFIVDTMLKGDSEGEGSGKQFIMDVRDIHRYVMAAMIVITYNEKQDLMYYRQFHCFRTMHKNTKLLEVKWAIEEALELPRLQLKKKEYINIRAQQIIVIKKISSVIYITKSKGIMTMHSIDGECEIEYSTLFVLLEELDAPQFAQCNRNTVLNMEYIEQINPTMCEIVLKKGYGRLKIGVRLKKRFMERYQRWREDYI